MPVYEFYCSDCELVTQTIRKIEEREEECLCYKCGKPISRIVSAANFTFLNDPQRLKSAGLKRSLEHTKKVCWNEYKEKQFYNEPKKGKK